MDTNPLNPPTPAAALRCAVTGAGGFIGSRLLTRWLEAGQPRAVALVRSTEAATRLSALGHEVATADLLRPATLPPALAACNAVVHLAHGDRGPEATRNLLQAMGQAGVRRLVHISTMSVHGPAPGPDAQTEETARIGRYGNDYCDSKAEQEELVWAAQQRGDVEAVILRPTVVYGPGSAFVSLVMDEARSGQVNWVDEGTGLCNAVYVDDVCSAIDAALAHPLHGEAFFINGDAPITWRRFIEAFADASPAPRFVNIDAAAATEYWAQRQRMPPRSLAQKVFDKLRRLGGENPQPAPFPPLGRIQRETIRIGFSNAKARRLLGWEPAVSFEDGVRLTKSRLRNESAA
jgi:nucleoside-diphosphate-sugar epimerase